MSSARNQALASFSVTVSAFQRDLDFPQGGAASGSADYQTVNSAFSTAQ